jgi:sialate O-acetylesterase
MTRRIGELMAGVLLLSFAADADAQLELPVLFGDGMVIQRGAEVPVWGWADPGITVEVMFRDQSYRDIAREDGSWRINLPSMHAGGPFELMIVANDKVTRISDILIGDVWVASGQSNMEWAVIEAMNAEQEISSAHDTSIRHFKVPRSWSWEPEDRLAGGSWDVASPETVGDFTAVGYFFAREIRKHVDVPIGILNTSWGGSRLEPWMSAASLGMDADTVGSIRSGVERWKESIREDLKERLGEFPEVDQGLVEGEPLWADSGLDDSDWDTLETPGVWESGGYAGMDGIGWYRKTFELSEEEAAAGALLGVAMIDDSDITWVNGVRVGGKEMAWNEVREYEVPAEVLKAGEKVVAIRVEDTGGDGGVHGDSSLAFVQSNGRRLSLAGPWLFRVGAIRVNLDGFMNQVPTLLYNKMIFPLLDFPITGALWYQGESNARDTDALKYRTLFKDMISGWRDEWGVGDFPFLYVQLANYMAAYDIPTESSWAVLRESQGEVLSLPNTAQAVIIDIGEADDIHPKNKQDVGYRLAQAALKLEYGKNVVHSGPVLSSFELTKGRAVLGFDHVAEGLELRGLEPGVHGFAIAGADSNFVWANVQLEGDVLIVWSDKVTDPIAVRYAWADNPIGANLYNSEGLPASPFRTDDW